MFRVFQKFCKKIPIIGRLVLNITETSSSDGEPRSGERYIAWGVSPRIGAKKGKKPRSGDRHIAPTPAAYAAAENLSPPSGASGSCDAWYLGLTPQAKYLSRLRRSHQGVISNSTSRSFFLGVSRGIAGGALITGYWLLLSNWLLDTGYSLPRYSAISTSSSCSGCRNFSPYCLKTPEVRKRSKRSGQRWPLSRKELMMRSEVLSFFGGL